MSQDTTTDILQLSDKAIQKISKILAKEQDESYFRVAVNGGGCSGFQYEFGTTQTKNDDDHEIKCGDYIVLLDDISVPFVKGSILDYVTEMIGAGFEIKNPNAKSSCGCGVSFSV